MKNVLKTLNIFYIPTEHLDLVTMKFSFLNFLTSSILIVATLLSAINRYTYPITNLFIIINWRNHMKTVYIYLLDTLADWEIGYITSELRSKRFFKKDAPEITIKTVSYDLTPITTMGGFTLKPDCLVADILVNASSTLLLPGADTWHEQKHQAILGKTRELLDAGATIGGICGATAALANVGILDDRMHTSNGLVFLDMFAKAYHGHLHYLDEPAVSDRNLITANSTAGLLWTKLILEQIGVFEVDTLTAWYHYFSTGDAAYFFEMMQSLTAKPDQNQTH